MAFNSNTNKRAHCIDESASGIIAFKRVRDNSATPPPPGYPGKYRCMFNNMPIFVRFFLSSTRETLIDLSKQKHYDLYIHCTQILSQMPTLFRPFQSKMKTGFPPCSSDSSRCGNPLAAYRSIPRHRISLFIPHLFQHPQSRPKAILTEAIPVSSSSESYEYDSGALPRS